MTEENWIDWPNGATLESLPVGARVAYPKARYERTGQGLHCYWSDSIGVVKGRDCLLNKDWVAPQKVALPSGYRFEGSEVVKGEELRQLVCRKVECARCNGLQSYNLSYLSADGQRFYCSKGCHDLAETKPAIGVDPVTAQAYQQQIYAQQGCLGLSDYVFRQGNYPHQAQPKKKPACKCGATENVRDVTPAIRHKLADLTGKGVRHDYLCGPCYQTQRRAQLQAQKLEQTKRDMDRPVKRDPYEWLGFSSPTYEE